MKFRIINQTNCQSGQIYIECQYKFLGIKWLSYWSTLKVWESGNEFYPGSYRTEFFDTAKEAEEYLRCKYFKPIKNTIKEITI